MFSYGLVALGRRCRRRDRSRRSLGRSRCLSLRISTRRFLCGVGSGGCVGLCATTAGAGRGAALGVGVGGGLLLVAAAAAVLLAVFHGLPDEESADANYAEEEHHHQSDD